MTALVLEWQRADALRVGWVPSPRMPSIPAAIVGPPGAGGSGGGLTAVSGTAPITSSGGTAPVIGIAPATPGAAGSMSAADKMKLDTLPIDPLGLTQAAAVGAAGTISLGVRTFAGREMLMSRGSLWPEEALQGRFDRMGRVEWRAAGGNSTITAMGASALTLVGTNVGRGISTTNPAWRARRIGNASAATAGALAGYYYAVQVGHIGNGAGLGGFDFCIRFMPSDAATVSGARMFAGMTSSIVAPTNVEPSAMTNAIGVAALSGSANLHIICAGSSAQAPVDLGSDFPANTLQLDIYEVRLFAPPGSQDVYWRVERNPGFPANSFVAEGSIANVTPGTTLPFNTTPLSPRIWRSNNATAIAVAVDLILMSVETPV